jgi:hypothetical protein
LFNPLLLFPSGNALHGRNLKIPLGILFYSAPAASLRGNRHVRIAFIIFPIPAAVNIAGHERPLSLHAKK